MTRDDFAALGVMGLFIALACLIGAICALFSHWLCLVFYRLGAVENPAQYLAYLITFGLMVFIVGAVMNRVTTNRWPW